MTLLNIRKYSLFRNPHSKRKLLSNKQIGQRERERERERERDVAVDHCSFERFC